jgi:hypothetical protein
MKIDLLNQPFSREEVREREGHRGQRLAYIDVAAVIRRLNEAFEHMWSFEVIEHHVRDGEVIVLGKLTAGGIVKSAFGGTSVTVDRVGDVVSIADDLKAASSDALKKAASMLGIALDLYGGQREVREPRAESPQRERPPGRSRPLMPTERITARQLGALHSACRDHGLTRGDLESLAQDRTGKRELSQLSRIEASALIDELRSGGNGAAPQHA